MNPSGPVAQIDPEALFGMSIGFGMMVVVPIIWMLLRHQRSMAALFHGTKNSEQQARIERLETELLMLRRQLAEQIVRLDDHETAVRRSDEQTATYQALT